MVRRRLRRLSVPLLVLASAGGTAADPDTASLPTLSVFESCELRGSGGSGRVDAQCATFTVAENPDDPASARIELFVARLDALSPEPREDAITLINGGPGGSSVSLYVDLQGAFSTLRRERDIVIVDQRGTGRSSPLDCPTLEDATHQFEPDVVRRATRTCLDNLARNPHFYTTSVAVGDLEALRRALGYRQWNLYGVSYGTRVAQHYLERFPAAVRTLIIDGVVPPGLALGPDIALNAQSTLDAIIRRCESSDYCAEAFPRLPAHLAALSERLREAPPEMAIPHPVTGRMHTFTLHYAHLALTLRLLSYAPETAAVIPLIIEEAAERENYVPLAAQALRIEHELGESISFGMHNSVVCTEDVPFYELDGAWPRLEASYLGADQVRALQTICEQWPAGTLHPALPQVTPSSKPVLLLSGEFDPITPPVYAERAAQAYPNGRHLVAPGQGHGVIGRGCVPQLVEDFVDSADAAALDAACLDRLGPDAFFVDLLGPPP